MAQDTYDSQKVGIRVEIILEARCLNRATERRTFHCQSISERPGKHVFGVAPDGAFISSEIEPRTLVVKGINVQEVEDMGWQPTDVQYQDEKTGELNSFMVHRSDTLEPNTVLFGIDAIRALNREHR